MKILIKLCAAAAALALASPAFACGEEKVKAAEARPEKPAVASKPAKKMAPQKAPEKQAAPAVASRS